MKILIIGAGRMGIRHLQGILSVDEISQVTVVDISPLALDNACKAVGNDIRLKTYLISEFIPQFHDVCIIANTAKNRKESIDLAVKCGCRDLMIEKPLGQSYEEVEQLVKYLDSLHLTAVVNLNMRQYEPIKKLANDFKVIPQLKGDKVITLNTGTLGIGCNGIHYLDKLFFILDADEAEIISAEIEESLIPSGRGQDYCDFGGWAVIKFYKNGIYLARTLISMSSQSTAFGGWEIIAPYGRIIIDEIAGTRITILRKEDSQMPLNRYAADYMPPVIERYEAPLLSNLTAAWIYSLLDGRNELPQVKESLKAHKLMFDWLSFSKTFTKIFPIT